jgi:hypothetical protein
LAGFFASAPFRFFAAISLPFFFFFFFFFFFGFFLGAGSFHSPSSFRMRSRH